MPRNYKKKKKLYMEASIEQAMKEVNDGKSIQNIVKKYHMSRCLLDKRLKVDAGSVVLKKRGHNTVLSSNIENNLGVYKKNGTDGLWAHIE